MLAGSPGLHTITFVFFLELPNVLYAPRQAMANQGSGGAYEISQRMTAAVGWGATAKFQENWVWDQAAETYVLDENMASKLRKSNPEVYSRRLLNSHCGTTARRA